MVASGYYGPEIWQSRAADVLGFERLLQDARLRDLWVPVLTGAVFFAHLPSWYLHTSHQIPCHIIVEPQSDSMRNDSIKNVVAARRKAGLPVAPVFLEWTPMIIFTASCCGWLYSPYSSLLTDNHLVLFCLTISFVFGRMTTKIILAHLTRQPFPYWTMMFVPLMIGAALVNGPVLGLYVSLATITPSPLHGKQKKKNTNSLYSPQLSPATELLYLRFSFIFSVVVYGRWAMLVINGICAYLGIKCLRIPYKKPGEVSHSTSTANGGATRKMKQGSGVKIA